MRMKMPKWKRTPGQAPAARPELERFLDLNCSGDALAKLRLIITSVIFQSLASQKTIAAYCRKWGMNHEKANEFLQGNVEFGFRWYSIEGVLTDCGADSTHLAVARDLFNEFPRKDQPAMRVSGAPGAESGAADPEGGEGGQDEPPRSAGQPEQPLVEVGGADGDRNVPDEPSTTQTAPSDALKPDPRRAKTAEQYISMLQAYRVWKGEPPYRGMADLIGNRYAASTLQNIGNNKSKLPKQALAVAYIESLGADAAECEEWRAAWRRIKLDKTARNTDPGPADSEAGRSG